MTRQLQQMYEKCRYVHDKWIQCANMLEHVFYRNESICLYGTITLSVHWTFCRPVTRADMGMTYSVQCTDCVVFPFVSLYGAVRWAWLWYAVSNCQGKSVRLLVACTADARIRVTVKVKFRVPTACAAHHHAHRSTPWSEKQPSDNSHVGTIDERRVRIELDATTLIPTRTAIQRNYVVAKRKLHEKP